MDPKASVLVICDQTSTSKLVEQLHSSLTGAAEEDVEGVTVVQTTEDK